MSADRRVVVTGLGLETAAGSSLDQVWEKVRSGSSCIRPLPDPLAAAGCSVGGQVLTELHPAVTGQDQRRASRFQLLNLSAIARAIEHAGLDPGSGVALYTGTSLSGMPDVESYYRSGRNGLEMFDRLAPTKYLSHVAASWAAQRFGLRGECLTIGTACAASTDAIRLAAAAISSGCTDRAIASGTEAWLTPVGISSFSKLKALTSRPSIEAEVASRPFDRARDGLVPAEGAGAIVLETMDSAVARNATPLAVIAGWGSTCDAFNPVAPDPEGTTAARSIELAVAMAGLSHADIDHVNCHGTSTTLNDPIESRVLRQALRSRADDVTVTATKSVVGHTLGAGGVIETIVTVMTLQHQFAPPTANFDEAGAGCDLDVLRVGRSQHITCALKTSFGFGGHNTALLLLRH